MVCVVCRRGQTESTQISLSLIVLIFACQPESTPHNTVCCRHTVLTGAHEPGEAVQPPQPHGAQNGANAPHPFFLTATSHIPIYQTNGYLHLQSPAPFGHHLIRSPWPASASPLRAGTLVSMRSTIARRCRKYGELQARAPARTLVPNVHRLVPRARGNLTFVEHVDCARRAQRGRQDTGAAGVTQTAYAQAYVVGAGGRVREVRLTIAAHRELCVVVERLQQAGAKHQSQIRAAEKAGREGGSRVGRLHVPHLHRHVVRARGDQPLRVGRAAHPSHGVGVPMEDRQLHRWVA
jgi:hypothetical protein